jgi:cytochrome P450
VPAGHDSTSTAITFLLMNVAMHGEVERKILEEVERVVGDGPLTFAHLGKLEYCTAVINESLRMFPPAQGQWVQHLSHFIAQLARHELHGPE